VPSFLEGSLAKTLHNAMKNTVAYDVTLIRVTEVKDGSGGFTTTEASVAGKGFQADYSDFYRVQAQIPVGDRKVFIFEQSMLDSAGAAISPDKHDKVTIRGETLTIVAIKEDPAEALWELQCRPIND
jgi:hypothetical protein